MKLVQFKDGTFGVRRGFWIFTRFLSLETGLSWWTPESADGGRIQIRGTREDVERAKELRRRHIAAEAARATRYAERGKPVK